MIGAWLLFATFIPREGFSAADSARRVSLAAGGLAFDRSLSVAAAAHLSVIIKNPRRANLAEIQALLTRQGDALSRVRPFASLGPDTTHRTRSLLEAARRSRTAKGFTHFGLAENDRGLVAIFGRRTLALAPTLETRSVELILRGRAPAGARLEAWSMGPGQIYPRSKRVRRNPSGTFLAMFSTPQPGLWTVELTVDVGHGPEVAMLRRVYVDDSAPDVVRTRSLSSSRHTDRSQTADRRYPDDPTRELARLRASYDLAPLRAHQGLHQAAQGHAQAVCDAGWAVHRLSGGEGPNQRAARAGFKGRVLETVALASSVPRAWKNLKESPAHLAGLLAPTMDSFGVGVVTGARSCLVILLGSPETRSSTVMTGN